MAKSNFLVRGGADFSGIKREMQKTQAAMSGFQAGISKSMSIVGKVLGSLAVGKLIKDSTAMAMGVESSMDNIKRNMKNSSKAFQDWINAQSKPLGLAKAEAYKYGSTFSNLLGSFQKDAKQTADSTQELMKAAAIISSKTGRTYDDTANRIRSGMLGSTEAIEDLGVYTNISMIESTEAFKKFAGSKSWAQLDFQTQQQIRLAAILEQTYARYGDTLADTTTTRQNQFIASLKNAQLSLGQAFLPIYNAILPALTRMADALGVVINKIAQFSQALFGKANVGAVENTDEQAAAMSGLGDATEKTGKQAKKAKASLAGFDQLNILSKKSSSDNEATGAGTSDLSLVGGEIGSDVTVSPDIENAINGIKDQISRIKDYTNTYLTKPFNDALNTIRPKIEEFKGILSGVWSDIGSLGQPLKNWFMSDFTPFLQKSIEFMGKIVSGLFDSFNMVFSDIWDIVIYPALSKFISIGLPMWTDFFTKAIDASAELFDETKKIFDMLWREGAKPSLEILMKIWSDMVTSLSKAWDTYGGPIFEGMKQLFRSIGMVLKTVWETTLKPVWDTFMQTVDWLWSKHLKPLLDNIITLVGEFIVSAFKIINEFIAPLIKAFLEVFGPTIANVFQTVISILGTFLAAAADVISGVITVIRGIVEFLTGVFTGDWKKAWSGIVTVFKGIFEGIVGIMKGVINIVIDLVNSMIRAVTNGLNFIIDGMNKIKFKVPDWVPKIGGKKWGIEISEVQAYTIPKLATGAITAVNNPFMAVVGDNKTQKEVISPLDDLLGMITTAVSSASGGSQGSGGDMYLTIKIGEDTFVDKVVNGINRQNRINGKTVITI